LLDKPAELVDINRLDKIIIRALSDGLLARFNRAVSGDQYDLCLLIVFLCFAKDVQAVDVTFQFKVGDDNIDVLRADNFEGIFPRVDGDGFGGYFLKRLGDPVGVVTLVVNNQNYDSVFFQPDTSLIVHR
jgi:hypothetical protein